MPRRFTTPHVLIALTLFVTWLIYHMFLQHLDRHTSVGQQLWLGIMLFITTGSAFFSGFAIGHHHDKPSATDIDNIDRYDVTKSTRH